MNYARKRRLDHETPQLAGRGSFNRRECLRHCALQRKCVRCIVDGRMLKSLGHSLQHRFTDYRAAFLQLMRFFQRIQCHLPQVPGCSCFDCANINKF